MVTDYFAANGASDAAMPGTRSKGVVYVLLDVGAVYTM